MARFVDKESELGVERQKPQETIIRETKRIAAGVTMLFVIMLIIYAVLGKLSPAVVLGGVLGSAYAVLNFFMLGMTVQKVAGIRAENEELARMQMRTSYQSRMIGMVVVVVIAFAVPFIDGLACLIPMVFPRLTILALQITGQIKD